MNEETAPPADGVPAGFVLVPVEPTDAMLSEGGEQIVGIKQSGVGIIHAKRVYRAMLSAAPKAPTDPIGEVTRPGMEDFREAVGSLLDDRIHAEARRRTAADVTQSGYEHHLVRVAGEHACQALAAPAADGLRSARSDTDLLNALRDECWDLRCMSVATGGDDYDVMWKVVGHWMADPVERIVAEGWSDDPRVAIRAALDQPQSGEGGE